MSAAWKQITAVALTPKIAATYSQLKPLRRTT